MANKKITQLPSAGTLDGTEIVPLVKNGITSQTTTQDIADLGGGGGTFTDVENTQTITGTSIILPNTPNFIYGVFMNGQRLTLTVDYTISTNTITLTTAADSDSFTIIYKY